MGTTNYGLLAIEGTIPYLSPEQAKGLPPDSPSDMYSFGVTLYEMVTGRRPFHGEDVSVLVHHLNSIPPPPTRFMQACPPRLETLILNLLEKDPELRPSASGAAEELQSIRAELLGERSEFLFPSPPTQARMRRMTRRMRKANTPRSNPCNLGGFQMPSNTLRRSSHCSSPPWR